MTKSFVKHVKSECKRYDIKFIMSDKDCFIEDGMSFGGYFDHENKEIAISNANNEDAFISILVHEFSHMEQWIYDDPTYTHKMNDGQDSTYILNNWLSGTDYNYDYIKHAVDIIRECELNCERRAIENINKYNININIQKYAQNANVYIIFYHYVLLKRRWEYTPALTEINDIIVKMPCDMESMDYSVLTNYHKNLFDIYAKNTK